MMRSFSPSVLRKSALWAGGIVAAIALIGFIIIPAALRPMLERKLSEALNRQVTVRSVSFNPFALSFALRGVTISQRGSSEVMVSFDEFFVNLQAMSVVKRGLIASSVRLVKPYVNITRNKDLSYSFSDLLVPPAAPPPAKEKPGEPFRFSINNIEVKDGSADFLDAPRNTLHTVRALNVSVPFISNLPYDLSSYVEPYFTATINKTVILLKGKTLPFEESLETTLDIDLKDIDLAHYMAYSPVPLRFKVLSGSLDVQATVSFKQFKDRKPVVSLKGTVAVKDIKLADTQRKALVEFSRFSVSFLPSDLMAKEVHLSDISLVRPKLTVDRDREGKLGIVAAFVVEKAKAGEKAAAPAEEPPQEAAIAEGAGLPVVDVDSFSINDGTILFTDWTPVPPAAEAAEDEAEPVRLAIEKIALKCGALSTRKDKKGTVSLALSINKKGSFSTKGTLGLDPLDLDAQVNVSDLALPAFQPYVAQKADILLNGGRFYLLGAFRFLAREGQNAAISYRGNASLKGLAVLDTRTDEELLAWKELAVEGIDAAVSPLAVKIRTISLNDFSGQVIVEEDSTLNLQNIVKKASPPDAAAKGGGKEAAAAPSAGTTPAEPATPPDIAIGQVLLTGGSIGFADRHISPMYTANLAAINGKLTGLSNRAESMADVQLRASWDQYAPFEMAGKVSPVKDDLLVDLKVDFRDLELSTLTPYSGTYIGRAIEKGKLNFGLQYNIVKKKLDAKNDIFIDQLTLGEKIESPKATSLPVGLAISLLKDRKGEIRLDIPVEGDIDNPEFRVWKVVWQVLGNLVVKAATSPFALLGSLRGGGEELGYVEFDAGSSAVGEPARKKLEALVNALYERPSLKLEIAGYVDPASDREALRAARMKALIVVEKAKDLSGDQQAQAGMVEVSPAEYPVYLKKAYKAGKFAKPRNVLGIAKDLPDGEMEKLLLENIRIADDDLRQLASTRARVVKDAIVRQQKVEPERTFLIEPKSMTPEQKEKIRNSRVDFTLK